MKLPLTAALAVAALAAVASASDTDKGTALVPNSHGGYNVVQQGATSGTLVIPFFGKHGYASKVIAEAHEKPKFILVHSTQDTGHGSTIVVYKKKRFATAEEAEAAKNQSQ
jgi:hypothetical protein